MAHKHYVASSRKTKRAIEKKLRRREKKRLTASTRRRKKLPKGALKKGMRVVQKKVKKHGAKIDFASLRDTIADVAAVELPDHDMSYIKSYLESGAASDH